MKKEYFEPIFTVEKIRFVQDLLTVSAEDAVGSLDGEWGEGGFDEDWNGDDFFG